MYGDSSTDGFPGFVLVVGVVFGLFFLALLGFIIFSMIRNARALKKAGLDPITAESQIAGKVANSQLIAPKVSIEERLRELDDLRKRGVISDEELASARAEALRGS